MITDGATVRKATRASVPSNSVACAFGPVTAKYDRNNNKVGINTKVFRNAVLIPVLM